MVKKPSISNQSAIVNKPRRELYEERGKKRVMGGKNRSLMEQLKSICWTIIQPSGGGCNWLPIIPRKHHCEQNTHTIRLCINFMDIGGYMRHCSTFATLKCK